MLEMFKTSERAVLLGARSFWEGVDIPGEALSALVIVRLPFAVPNEPIVAARSETYSDGFGQYSLPEAVLRFRQGFGRLIRTATDRGVVVVLDGRIISKRYARVVHQCPARSYGRTASPRRSGSHCERLANPTITGLNPDYHGTPPRVGL